MANASKIEKLTAFKIRLIFMSSEKFMGKLKQSV